jgi:hypothetical protein
VTSLIRRVVTVDWPKTVERDAKSLLIRTARTGHQKIMADAKSKGMVPSWEAYANTPGNKDLASVKLPGPIVYNYRYLTELIQFALDELRRQSPVISGDYVRSHTLYVNGSPVDVIPKTMNPGDRFIIANPIPYARKIEIGKTKTGRAFVIQVPNRIYARVAEIVEARAKGRAKVKSIFVNLGAGALAKNQAYRTFHGGKMRVSRTQRKDRIAGSAITSPAIIIEPVI